MAPLGRSVSGPVADLVRDLVRIHPGWSAGQVHREVEDRMGTAAVSLRTVQRYMTQQPKRADGSWALETAESDEARLVLPVLAHAAWTLGRRIEIDQSAGQAIAKVRSAAPDVPLWDAYVLGQALADGETERVTDYLAFEGWRDDGEPLRKALTRGLVRLPVLALQAAIRYEESIDAEQR